jgi:hypothetical protein
MGNFLVSKKKDHFGGEILLNLLIYSKGWQLRKFKRDPLSYSGKINGVIRSCNSNSLSYSPLL